MSEYCLQISILNFNANDDTYFFFNNGSLTASL